MEPKGLKLLKGPKRSYEFMVKELDHCSEVNDCECCLKSRECDKIFKRRCEEWQLRRTRIEPAMPRLPLEQKYANWMPVLSSRDITQTIRERYVYP